MADSKMKPVTPLKPDTAKILAAISFLLQKAAEENLEVTQYDLVKSLFVADTAHLNKYGRPITFDNYVAMKDGPVPSLSYNFLKRDEYSMRRFKMKDFPWTSKAAPHIGERAEVFSLTENVSDKIELLSPSDMEELSEAMGKVKALGFKQVRKMTHEHPAYVAAWMDDGHVRSFSMSLSLLFDKPNEEQAQNLVFLSQHH